MAFAVGVGLSRNRDSYQAGYEAGKYAYDHSGAEMPHVVIVFASASFNQQEVVRGVREATGKALLVGCSTAGEITNEGPRSKSVGVMAIRTDRAHFIAGLGNNIKENARAAGQAAAREVKEVAPTPLRAFLMFSDVLAGNGAETVRGALDVLGAHFPVVGGAAGDDFLFKQTYEYRDDDVVSGAVAGVGIAGDFAMGIGVRHGWMPIGSPMIATKSRGAVLYELDGKPAVGIYEDYFGKKAEDLRKEPLAQIAITYPLGIKAPEIDEYLIRDPITVDESGAITCAAEIPEGSEVRLMIGSREEAVAAAEVAARKLTGDFEATKTAPKFLLMFNCIAREKLFGSRAKEEIDAVMRIVGRDVPLLGFYTYGEVAPINGEIAEPEKINSRFYNETIVLFAVGE